MDRPGLVTADAASSPTEIAAVGFVRGYLELIRPARRSALALVVLGLTSALMEGLALAALIPMLSTSPRLDVGSIHMAGGALRRVSLLAVVIVGLLAAGTKYLSESRSLRFLGDTEERLRRDVTAQYLAMNWSDFVSMRLGDVNSATLLAASQIAIGVHFFLRAVSAVLAAGALTVLSFIAAPVLSLVLVTFGGLVIVGYRIGARRAQVHARELTARADDIGVAVQDVFANLKFFQSTGNLSSTEEQTSVAYRRYAATWYQSQRYGPLMRMWFESGAVLAVSLILGLALAADGVISPRVVAFLAIFSRAVPRVTMAQEWAQLARVHFPWLEAWRQRSDVAQAHQRTRNGGVPPVFENSIRIRDVSFSYPDTNTRALDHASWTLPHGSFVALVGASGSGKTTMLDLITGLLDTTSGTISIDGAALEQIDLDRWQSRIGLVMQSNPMLHTSIADNVRWTEPELDLARLRSSLDLANASAFVDALPEGIETIVGEAGAKLSGGQIQRLALARALYRDPWLLVLDEPTSALDAESEQAILASLERLRGRRTIVVSTHRLALARSADQILLLEHGAIVERGTWEELVASGGRFARLSAGRTSLESNAVEPRLGDE